MNRRIHTGIFVAVVCLAFGLLTGCSSSSSKPAPTIAITASSGGGQSAGVGVAFTNPLVANVTSGGMPASGVTVTFSAPASGASCTPSAATATTDSSGNASITCTANSTAGGPYNVTASAAGATGSATFALTNTTTVTSANYVFYASGEEVGSGLYYAIAGVVTVDSNGNVLGGEEDYNDGTGGLTSPGEPNTPDTIAAGGTAVVDPTTGLGTVTITSSNTLTGASGVQTFAIQFVNPNHALIMQFDGSATSSGSLDLQTAGADGNYAFAVSGLDPSVNSWAFGGVFTLSSGTITGVLDENDATAGAVSTNNAFGATAAAPDSFGRSVVTGITDPLTSTPITFAAYAVGPEAMRLIDVDFTSGDTAVGSALGQGSAAFDDTSLTAGVFAEIGQWSWVFGTVGEFNTDQAGNILSGSLADDNELDTPLQQIGVDQAGGTYDLVGSGINGYGSMALPSNGNVTALGVYMVDPALNINDPNNTSTDLGGALIVDLSLTGATQGGMGVITPQTDSTAADFSGNYAAGFQNFNDFAFCCNWEFDMVGPFTMASGGALTTASIGADDSDPNGSLTGTPGESTGDVFGPTTPVAVSPGYFTMQGGNALGGTINGAPGALDVDIYQASATTLYWINTDYSLSLFVGSLQQQSGILAKAHAAKRPAPKATRKATTKTFKNRR